MKTILWLPALMIGLLPQTCRAAVEVVLLTEENWQATIPAGKEVDAIIGDLVIKNDYLTAVIAKPVSGRNANMTVKEVGGCLIDLTVNSHNSDQLSCYYPGGGGYPFREWKVLDAQQQLISLESGKPVSTKSVTVVVAARGDGERPACEVRYLLQENGRSLLVEQKFTNESDRPMPVKFRDLVRIDGGKEDLLKTPNGEHDLFWADDRFWQQAYGFQCHDGTVVSRSDARSTLLEYRPQAEHKIRELQPNSSAEITIRIDVNSHLTGLLSQVNSPLKPQHVALTFQGITQPIPGLRLELTQGESYAGTLWADGSGRVECSLLPGVYRAQARFAGIDVGARFELTVDQSPITEHFDLPLGLATWKVNVTDQESQPIPCKLELISKTDPAQALDFGPESAEFAVKNLRYLPQGRLEILLPAGQYEVILSRGPEHDAIFTSIKLVDEQILNSDYQLSRTVQTPGWVSTEYHSHSSPSGDNTSSQLGRVLNLVCEHLEFAPCTEHNRIDTYADEMAKLQVEKFLASCTGMELTGSPLPLNHQNVFPLVHYPGSQDGGAPLTDTSPEKQIQRIALWDNRSEKLIQQNHPDIGWLFYDKDGDAEPDEGHQESFPFIDAMEIHPIVDILKYDSLAGDSAPVRKNRMFNWLQLLNQGFRITGVVNTDAHYNFHGSGGFRNWVRSSTDDPAEIDTLEMVKNSQAGHLIMSNGPYLQVELTTTEHLSKTFIPGDELAVHAEPVSLNINVQTPNWFDIDRVFVLVNGRSQPEWNFTRDSHPQLFTSAVVKFDHQLTLPISTDAHLIVVAAGEKSQLGPVAGPEYGQQSPVAVSNPIFLDTSGDGFQANQDLLDGALPVKGD